MSSRPHNNDSEQLSDDNIIPDVELTTASEVDGRPFQDDKESQAEDDKDKVQKTACHCDPKVG